jgi:hypothetical protein
VPSALDQPIAALPEGDQVKAQAVTKVALEIDQTVDRILRTQSLMLDVVAKRTAIPRGRG